jgi:hypothetical protein
LSWFSTESPMWPQETSQFLANHDGGIMTTTVLVSTHCVTLNKSPLSLDLSCFLVKLDCLRLTVVPWMASRFHEAGMARVTLLYSTLITAHNSLGSWNLIILEQLPRSCEALSSNTCTTHTKKKRWKGPLGLPSPTSFPSPVNTFTEVHGLTHWIPLTLSVLRYRTHTLSPIY